MHMPQLIWRRKLHQCPICHQKTLSTFASLFYYSKKGTTCSNCGANVRRKMRLSDYLVPIYLLATIAARRLFHIDTENNLGAFLAIGVALFVIQLKLVAYEAE